MKWLVALAAAWALLEAPVLAKRSLQHVNKREYDGFAAQVLGSDNEFAGARTSEEGASSPKKRIIAETEKTNKYSVNGTNLPFVDFDIGESYAGLLPIDDDASSDPSQLYFWFFPSENPQASDEILIWLNGGPGCSSLEGLFQENGPVVWQYGTYRPVKNPWTWVNLTNVVWVEQPAGTGFSQARKTPRATNEIEVADQFLGFWKNFVDTFGLHGRKVYITGESYAGYFIPYIADAMHNRTNTEYYNVEATMMFDPSTSYQVLQDDIPTAPFVNYWGPLFSLNDSFVSDLNARADSCGYTQFMEQAMTFPPTGPLPTPPHVDLQPGDECGLWRDAFQAALLVNPCFDVYQVATTCPLLWDVLGFPGSIMYEPAPWLYFNREDVKKVIHAPLHHQWVECASHVLDTDNSPPSGLSVLPRVIEKNKKSVIAHGMLDMVLIMNGTVMMIQNMTWNGAQGFSSPPSEWNSFYVPYHSRGSLGSVAGAGAFGTWHTERTLTFATVDLSGHMVPQYQPSAAYRLLEFLLDRIPDLSDTSGLTTSGGNSTG